MNTLEMLHYKGNKLLKNYLEGVLKISYNNNLAMGKTFLTTAHLRIEENYDGTKYNNSSFNT